MASSSHASARNSSKRRASGNRSGPSGGGGISQRAGVPNGSRDGGASTKLFRQCQRSAATSPTSSGAQSSWQDHHSSSSSGAPRVATKNSARPAPAATGPG